MFADHLRGLKGDSLRLQSARFLLLYEKKTEDCESDWDSCMKERVGKTMESRLAAEAGFERESCSAVDYTL
jgi:hypothetical protein